MSKQAYVGFGIGAVILLVWLLGRGGDSSSDDGASTAAVPAGHRPSAGPFAFPNKPLSSNAGFVEPRILYRAPAKTKPAEGEKVLKIVVTGGAGFIGSQLAYECWKKGHDVTLIDNMRFGYEDNLDVNGERFGTFILGDVLDSRTWKYYQDADVVYHFAALSALPVCQSHPRDAMENNVGGLASVMEGARMNNVKRVIFASTSATYERNSEPILTEDLTIAPTLLYSLTKQQGELLMRSYRDVYGIETVVLRFFNVYGPHQDFRRASPPFTSYVARELAHRRPAVLHGDGTQARDYVHVRDLMRLAMLVMTAEKADGETFNIASGKAYTVNAMYEIMAAAANASDVRPVFHEATRFWNAYPELFAGGRPIKKAILQKEVMKKTTGSHDKAERLLGWKPEVTMEEGLAELVHYIKEAARLGKDKNAAPVAW